MSIQSEINRINSNVQSALNAVADTGVSVPEGANSNNLPVAVSALANEKQDKLTFDAAPTANSTNPVTSGGVKTALDKKASATSLGAHTGNTDNPHQVTAAQVGAISSSEKGAASGVATLGTDGKVPESQLPEISSVKTFTATIGTTWTENGETGVKSQSVPIAGVLAKHTAKVDHAYTGDGTSDGYEAFVEAENQYLTCITNGYAETYNGGITFYIFGDAPTVSIPIVVEVA